MTRLHPAFSTTLPPLALLLALSLCGKASAQDPFSPGERWHFQAPAAQPWIPRSVSFAARDELIWLGTKGAGAGLGVLDARATGAHSTRFHDGAANAITLATAAGDRADALYSLAQYAAPTVYQKRTEATRYDPLAAARGGAFSAVWTHDVGFLTTGAAHIATDASGDRVVLAVWDGSTGEVQVDWLDGESGALTQRVRVAGAALNALDLAAGGRRLAVAAGLDLYVIDAVLGVVFHAPLASATHAVSISDDGRFLAVGGLGELTLREAGASGYALTLSVSGPAGMIVTSADVSLRGETLAIGWWNYMTGIDARLEIWDGRAGVLLTAVDRIGASGSFQDVPAAARVTSSGDRIAFGAWGTGSNAEVLLFQRGESTPIAAIDTPGSVQAIDLDKEGTRVLIAYKDVHNNQFGDTGGLRLFDTGERSLQMLETAEVGGAFEFRTHLPGAYVHILLVGEAADMPTQIPGVAGGLWLRRSTLAAYVGLPDGTGRASFSLPIAQDPGLIGTQIAAQAAFRVPGGTVLMPTVEHPLVLPD